MAAAAPVPAPGAPPAAEGAPGALGATLKGKDKGECVKVVVRARPLFGKEINEGRTKIVHMDIKRGVANLRKPDGTDKDTKDFTFDNVFDETFTQQQIFEDTGLEIVESVMDGFNGTIFAYGQTGAGKSHTMTGPDSGSPDQMGLIPRSFKHIFDNIDTNSVNVKYLVRGSFLEIYNEEIRDLLSKNPKDRCELKDNQDKGVYVKDLSAFVVRSAEEMTQCLNLGLSNRSTGATNMNAESSRSHSIFTITVEQCDLGQDGEAHIRVGKLNMVDLAGSERQSKTGATGERLKEATKINLSLSALGNVISALVDGKSSHIPYRDSKLTRLLQDSLGGNTKTIMVANIGPADYNFDETLSTLRYAYRAKSIKNKPKINEDPKDAMIREFQDEIMRLKRELDQAAAVSQNGPLAEDEPDEIAVLEGIPGGPLQPKAKLAPIVQKQVEYVEKVVTKNVEKEVVIEHGPSPEEIAAMQAKLREQNDAVKIEAEKKRKEIQAKREMAEGEKKKLLVDIERQEKEAKAEQQRRGEMELKLQAMEQQMMAGKTVMEKAVEQEKILQKQKGELKKQRRREEALKIQEEAQRQENLDLETKCASQEEQVQKLTVKLQKLWDKYQKAQQEMVDVQQFNQGEREDMLSMIRDLRQTLKLKTLIMESFVPMKEVQFIHDRARWEPEEDEWVFEPIKLDPSNWPSRPSSCLGLPRPTSEFARVNRAMGDPNPRYRYDSILVTDLDMPERTTEDYDLEVQPELGDTIERALLVALSPDGDDAEDGDAKERPQSGRKRPSSGRPGTGRKREESGTRAQAFPQARGLVSRE